VLFRLDYLSCVLTIVSTILVGRRCWEGWILAAINSVVVCLIGFRTAQFGFIPANVFCIVLYGVNLRSWRKPEAHPAQGSARSALASATENLSKRANLHPLLTQK
jgi:nicotinamide riboside transporter PnuC